MTRYLELVPAHRCGAVAEKNSKNKAAQRETYNAQENSPAESESQCHRRAGGYKEPGSGAASLVREREQQPPGGNGPSVPHSSVCEWDLCLCIICDREWVPTRWEIASHLPT